MEPTEPLDLVAAEAEFFESAVATRGESGLALDVMLRRTDGKTVHYRIVASNKGSVVTAREETPERLPARCPERHINPDGTFCMYWAERHAIEVKDRPSAVEWWKTLIGFLRLQERASNLGRWPNDHSWAHGDSARYQHIATASAKRLGGAFERALREKRLRVELCPDKPNRKRMLRLLLDDKHLYTVVLDSLSIANGKQPCICSIPASAQTKSIRACGDHADVAARMATALLLWVEEDRKFWADFAGMPCCGQISDCPLARA